MGSGCNSKKCVISIVVVAVAYFLLDMLVWHVVLGGMVKENMALMRPEADIASKRWVAYVGYVLFAAVFNWIFCKGLESGKCPKGQGLKFGAIIGLLMWGAGGMLRYPFCPMSDGLYIGSALAGIVEYAVLGFIAGFLCKGCDDKSGNGGRCCS
jgi:hypothetical protein